ncbi:MAG TPA: L-2-hydroxyglutarate oxidase [Candidatus Acidoferrum sp.]|jgi:L-2-hydroxyglutarate oxidase|nr:L-2-hydroxyglutarate oxidase [Candidatus Acidoferrum sp.]
MGPQQTKCFDYAVIGGGIVGLAVAWTLQQRKPGLSVLVVEKEQDWARHQTGRNSGVIHSGIYYKPGSLKARMCREGNRRMLEFCRTYSIPHEVCGKVIVATEEAELPRLQALYERGVGNGLPVRKLRLEEVKEIEPNVRCQAGLHVPSTGIVDYAAVCRKLAKLIESQGGDLRLGVRLTGVRVAGGITVLETSAGDFETRCLLNCAGLHSDRVAKLAGATPDARIVPFRGEYYEVKPERRSLVRNLIYPVPNPEFPFLGVHFTRMIDGSIHAGPNAVLSLKREGYHRTAFNLRDFAETMFFPGFWRLAAKHAKDGLEEMHRSFSKAAFVRSLQRLIPEITADDLVPGSAGVRAQALQRDGGLVDDFLIIKDEHAVHVCNAPSPAATASLEIGRAVVAQVPQS